VPNDQQSEFPDSSCRSRAEELVHAFLAARDRGEDLDFEALCVEHPDHEEEMRSLLRLASALAHFEPDELGVPSPAPAPEAPAELRAYLERLELPDVVDRYPVRARLAEGGMGAVLRVRDRRLERDLALKVMLPRGAGAAAAGEGSTTPKVLARFLSEAQIMSQLDHPGVVGVHDLCRSTDGRAYYTMDLVRGSTLAQILETMADGRGSWSMTRVLGVVLKVCETLAYAHARGVVHRDVKPSNIMVGRFGEVFVMDWGLAKLVEPVEPVHPAAAEAARVPAGRPAAPRSVGKAARAVGASSSSLGTLDGDVVGTPAYMAPEQARGELVGVGPPCDVYSVGAVLYEILGGRAPHQDPQRSRSAVEVLTALRQGPPPALGRVAPRAEAELVAISEKAMARDVRQRYADGGELAEDLRAWLEGRVVSAHGASAWLRLRKWSARRPLLAAASALAVAAVLLGALFLGRTYGDFARGARAAWERGDLVRLQQVAAGVDGLLGGEAILGALLSPREAAAMDLLAPGGASYASRVCELAQSAERAAALEAAAWLRLDRMGEASVAALRRAVENSDDPHLRVCEDVRERGGLLPPERDLLWRFLLGGDPADPFPDGDFGTLDVVGRLFLESPCNRVELEAHTRGLSEALVDLLLEDRLEGLEREWAVVSLAACGTVEEVLSVVEHLAGPADPARAGGADAAAVARLSACLADALARAGALGRLLEDGQARRVLRLPVAGGGPPRHRLALLHHLLLIGLGREGRDLGRPGEPGFAWLPETVARLPAGDNPLLRSFAFQAFVDGPGSLEPELAAPLPGGRDIDSPEGIVTAVQAWGLLRGFFAPESAADPPPACPGHAPGRACAEPCSLEFGRVFAESVQTGALIAGGELPSDPFGLLDPTSFLFPRVALPEPRFTQLAARSLEPASSEVLAGWDFGNRPGRGVGVDLRGGALPVDACFVRRWEGDRRVALSLGRDRASALRLRFRLVDPPLSAEERLSVELTHLVPARAALPEMGGVTVLVAVDGTELSRARVVEPGWQRREIELSPALLDGAEHLLSLDLLEATGLYALGRVRILRTLDPSRAPR
jgi:serine/threonine protein kinase